MSYLFKPVINFKDDNLSFILSWAYNQVSTPKELVQFTFNVFDELNDYEAIEIKNDFEDAIVKTKIQNLKEICYPLYAYCTNRSFETKQFETY